MANEKITQIRLSNQTEYDIKDASLHPINLTGMTVDLNDYCLNQLGDEKVQYYYCTSAAGANNIQNKPINTTSAPTNEFFLTVKNIRLINTSDFVTKQTYEAKNGASWSRLCKNGTWSDWKDSISGLENSFNMMITNANHSRTFYVDPVNGNDENSGSPSAPLKTFRALTSKYGYLAHILVYLMNDTPIVQDTEVDDDKIIFYNFDYIQIESLKTLAQPCTLNCQCFFQNCDKVVIKNLKMRVIKQNYTASQDDEEETQSEYYMLKTLYGGNVLLQNCSFVNDPTDSSYGLNVLDSTIVLNSLCFIHSYFRVRNCTFSGATYALKSAYGSVGSMHSCTTPAGESENLHIGHFGNSIFNYFNSNTISITTGAQRFVANSSFIMEEGLQNVTVTKDGLMTKEDKAKLNDINLKPEEANGTATTLVTTGNLHKWNHGIIEEKGYFPNVVIKALVKGWSTFKGKIRDTTEDENSGYYVGYEKIDGKYYVDEHFTFYHVSTDQYLQYIRIPLTGTSTEGLKAIVRSDVATESTVISPTYNSSGYFVFNVSNLFSSTGTEKDCTLFDFHILGYVS